MLKVCILAISIIAVVSPSAEECQLDPVLKTKVKSFFTPYKKKVTHSKVIQVSKIKSKFLELCLVQIEDGILKSNCLQKQEEWTKMFQSIAHRFSNVAFLVNRGDGLVTNKNKCQIGQVRKICACDKDFQKPYHGGLFYDRKVRFKIDIPIFSSTTLPACSLDIVIPSVFIIQTTNIQQINWDQAIPKAFWRGSTTGGDFQSYIPHFSIFHRQRLVNICSKLNTCDAKFSAYIQCSDQLCSAMKQTYGGPDFIPQSQQPSYKALIDIDGNSYSGRFGRLLKTGSVVLKVKTSFEDFVTLFTQPWLHYLPVQSDLSDLEQKLDWILENDQQARAIARAGMQRANYLLNPKLLQCYFIAILEQYSKLYEGPQELTKQNIFKGNISSQAETKHD